MNKTYNMKTCRIVSAFYEGEGWVFFVDEYNHNDNEYEIKLDFKTEEDAVEYAINNYDRVEGYEVINPALEHIFNYNKL